MLHFYFPILGSWLGVQFILCYIVSHVFWISFLPPCDCRTNALTWHFMILNLRHPQSAIAVSPATRFFGPKIFHFMNNLIIPASFPRLRFLCLFGCQTTWHHLNRIFNSAGLHPYFVDIKNPTKESKNLTVQSKDADETTFIKLDWQGIFAFVMVFLSQIEGSAKIRKQKKAKQNPSTVQKLSAAMIKLPQLLHHYRSSQVWRRIPCHSPLSLTLHFIRSSRILELLFNLIPHLLSLPIS